MSMCILVVLALVSGGGVKALLLDTLQPCAAGIKLGHAEGGA